MSFILDALKKAEAERHVSAARNVQILPAFPSPRQPRAAWRQQWPWVILGVSITVAGAIVWSNTAHDTPTVVPQQATPIPVEPQTTTVLPPPDPTAAPVAKPPPAMPQEKAAKKPVEKKQAHAVAGTKATQAAPVEATVPTLRELPTHIQHEIPPLTVGGYIYSGNKAERSVLINKRLLREGEEVAPGLTLEKMMPTGMVMNYKGYRYRTSY